MEIQIPSPSVFLRKSPVLSNSLPTPVKNSKPAKPRVAAPPKPSGKANPPASTANAQKAGIVKPKQSKSRNGCMTCKKKRLKCDETKPTCVQCEKRNVECEGYKKDYKWRSFEDTTKTSRAGKGKKIGNNILDTTTATIRSEPGPVPEPNNSHPSRDKSWSPGLQNAFISATQALSGPPPSNMPSAGLVSPPRRFSPSQFDPLPVLHPDFSPSDFDLPPLPNSASHSQLHREHTNSHSTYSTGSPNLVDLLLPGTDLHQPPDLSEPRPPMSPLPYQPGLAEDLGAQDIAITDDEDFDEEIFRGSGSTHLGNDVSKWTFRSPSPALSDSSSTSERSLDYAIIRPPRLELHSPEMLMCRFVQETCGILSIKDGPAENPWRDLVLELGQDCEALSHAISSMSALHGATRDRRLRPAGIGHMNKSIRRLSAEIQSMRLDQALATSLALALGEGWDERISTGIMHLKGAKELLVKALTNSNQQWEQKTLTPKDAARMKFLCNTYVYMDVIARLTSTEEQGDLDLDNMLRIADRPFRSNQVIIDPLMGCATTLFPLMGKVASLVQQVRRTRSNTLNIVAEANDLREQLLDWSPPDRHIVEQPEDPNSSVHHAIHTAEAYRQAILLHLYQAVPELASEPSHILAQNIMKTLAGVPLSSNTLIVQIYPLLVGSCEMVSPEDRQFASKRWEAMMRRLAIMNVTSCWHIVQEVWARRDFHVQQQRLSAGPASSVHRSFSQQRQAPPILKRKATMPEDGNHQEMLDGPRVDDAGFLDHPGRPLKRRVTFDTQPEPEMVRPNSRQNGANKRPGEPPVASIEAEYTVRGHLHWLAVMADMQWEVFLG